MVYFLMFVIKYVQVYWEVALSLWVCKSTGVWRCVSGCASLVGCDAVSLGV